MLFTGLLMVGANAAFTSIRAHGCHLEIHLGYYDAAVLRLTYGWCFWLCLGVGKFSYATHVHLLPHRSQ